MKKKFSGLADFYREDWIKMLVSDASAFLFVKYCRNAKICNKAQMISHDSILVLKDLDNFISTILSKRTSSQNQSDSE